MVQDKRCVNAEGITYTSGVIRSQPDGSRAQPGRQLPASLRLVGRTGPVPGGALGQRTEVGFAGFTADAWGCGTGFPQTRGREALSDKEYPQACRGQLVQVIEVSKCRKQNSLQFI